MRPVPVLLAVLNDPVDFRLHRAPLLLAAAATGWRVHVAAPDEPAAADIRSAGLAYEALPLERVGTNPLADFRAARALAAICARITPDVLYLRAAKSILCGGMALRLMRHRPGTVAHFCGLGWLFTGGGVCRRMVRRLAGVIMTPALRGPRSAVVVQTAEDGEVLSRLGMVPADRLHTIAGSGVDCSRFAPSPEPTGVFTVVLPVRLLASKGVADFAAAARELKGSGIRMRLVGGLVPGNPDAIREEVVRSWIAEEILEWQGHREDMPAVLAEAHVVCFPSYYGEGVPKAVLEAAAAGRALVVADMPGTRAVVEHGVSGFVVPPRSPRALADAIRELRDDPERRRAFAIAARSRVEREFALSKIVNDFLALYRTVAGGGDMNEPLPAPAACAAAGVGGELGATRNDPDPVAPRRGQPLGHRFPARHGKRAAR